MSLEVHIEKKLNGFTLRSDFTAGNTATAILGASGCGKSMTLRCIAGIVRPDRGRITVDGVTFFDSERNINLPPQQRRVGLLFQNYALFHNMTVEENIAAGVREKLPQKEKLALAGNQFPNFVWTAWNTIFPALFPAASSSVWPGPHFNRSAAHSDAG